MGSGVAGIVAGHARSKKPLAQTGAEIGRAVRSVAPGRAQNYRNHRRGGRYSGWFCFRVGPAFANLLAGGPCPGRIRNRRSVAGVLSSAWPVVSAVLDRE